MENDLKNKPKYVEHVLYILTDEIVIELIDSLAKEITVRLINSKHKCWLQPWYWFYEKWLLKTFQLLSVDIYQYTHQYTTHI